MNDQRQERRGNIVRALYVHVPFCIRKCPYCDFYSVPVNQSIVGDYLQALRLEEERKACGVEAETVYVGGGTPSSLAARDLRQLLHILESHIRNAREITIEINPGTLDDEKAHLLLEAGVTRVSLGAQSLNDEKLERLGRIHDAAAVRASMERLRSVSFENVNLDLIFGAPGETTEDWRRDLRSALALRPDHVSIYGLTIEDETPFGRLAREGKFVVPDEDTQRAMMEIGIDETVRAGFEHYEISNYARPGKRCAHNLVYWRNEPYLGLGPSATSYIDGERRTNVRDITEYVRRLRSSQSAVETTERLSAEATARETAILGMRLLDGINVHDFRRRTGFNLLDLWGEGFEHGRGFGLLELCEAEKCKIVRLTREGVFVANALLADLAPDA